MKCPLRFIGVELDVLKPPDTTISMYQRGVRLVG